MFVTNIRPCQESPTTPPDTNFTYLLKTFMRNNASIMGSGLKFIKFKRWLDEAIFLNIAAGCRVSSIVVYNHRHQTQILNCLTRPKNVPWCVRSVQPRCVTSPPGSQWRSSYGDPDAVSVGTWRLEAHLGHCPYSGIQKMCMRLSHF